MCRPIRNTGDQGGELVFVAVRPQEQASPSGRPYTSSSLEAEKKRIALERARLEAERKRLDDEKRLLEERLKLAEERQQLAREKAKLEARRKQLAEEKHRYETKKKSTEESHQLTKEEAKLIAEQKRVAEEKRRLEETKKQQVASLPPQPSVSKPQVIERDVDFVKYDTGVVRDTKTGLEWFAGPEKKMTWDEANKWVEDLRIDGGGWRIPTDKELKKLYKKAKGNPKLASLLKVSRRVIFTEEFPTEVEGLSAAFAFNEQAYEEALSFHYNIARKWILAVRSR
jgi:hypothetical protein